MNVINVAAIQVRAEIGAVDKNLARAAALAREAFQAGAQWVVLPEFFPSGMAFSPAMMDAWQPLHGPALQLMRTLAREYEGVIGGSFLARSGHDCFNSFLLVFPDGRYFRHDKDLPSLWENSYYIGGHDSGILDTPGGRIGAALCWELIRSGTVRRLRGNVDLVVAGSCWWDLPLPVPASHQADAECLRETLREAPAQFARMAGVPVVHASHVGPFRGQVPGIPGADYASRFLGESQIVDAAGQVLARMAYEDGEGFVAAEIEVGRGVPSMPVPESFWTVALPQSTLQAWEHFNRLGRAYYAQFVRPRLA